MGHSKKLGPLAQRKCITSVVGDTIEGVIRPKKRGVVDC